jgi:hypothetical protein
MRVTISAANLLTIEPMGVLRIFGGNPITYFYGAAAPIPVTDPLTYPITISQHGTTPLNTNGAVGTVTTNITGVFSSRTSFTASIEVNPDLTFGGVAANCTSMVGTVTGTRVP